MTKLPLSKRKLTKIPDDLKDARVIFKDVKGYEGLYIVSSLGDVYSKFRRGTSGGKLKPYLTPAKDRPDNRYLLVRLVKNSVEKDFLVHRLIALNFIPNPTNLLQVNHINENKTDNRVENLEWVTQSQNKFRARMYKNNTSGHKGVSRFKNYWHAHIGFHGKRITRVAKTKQQAIELRKELELQYVH